MTDEIKVQSKNKKIKLIITIAAVVIAVLTISVIVLVSTNGATAKKVKEQLSLGDKYLAELQYEQAIAAYELAIEIDPKCEEAYFGLADVYIAMGDYEKAEKVLEEAKAVVGDEEALERIEEKRNAIDEKIQEAIKDVAIATPEPTVTPGLTMTREPTVIPAPTVTPRVEITAPLRWIVNEEGGITIQGSENEEITYVIIPEEIEGRKVTRIDDESFCWYSKLESVILPSSLKEIGSQAFFCCDQLRELEIKEGLQTIGVDAFAYCSSLESVEIPASVTCISRGAFRFCQVLREIRVKETNQYYLSEDGILFNKQKTLLLCMPGGKEIQEYVIPNGVEEIESSAFFGSRVSAVQVSSTVIRIRPYAFYDCYRLKELVIPSHVTEIGHDIVDITENSKLIVITPVGSYAESYAISNGIPVENE